MLVDPCGSVFLSHKINWTDNGKWVWQSGAAGKGVELDDDNDEDQDHDDDAAAAGGSGGDDDLMCSYLHADTLWWYCLCQSIYIWRLANVPTMNMSPISLAWIENPGSSSCLENNEMQPQLVNQHGNEGVTCFSTRKVVSSWTAGVRSKLHLDGQSHSCKSAL